MSYCFNLYDVGNRTYWIPPHIYTVHATDWNEGDAAYGNAVVAWEVQGQFQNQPLIGWLKKYKIGNKTLGSFTLHFGLIYEI